MDTIIHIGSFFVGLAGVLGVLLIFAVISFFIGGGLRKVEKLNAPVKVDHDHIQAMQIVQRELEILFPPCTY